MWDRKELKAKGKAAYRANRLMCIIAALLLLLVSGAGAGASGAGSGIRSADNDTQYYYDDSDGGYGDLYDEEAEFGDQESSTDDAVVVAAVVTVVIIIVLIVVAVGVVVGAFLLNPLQVGLRKFFVDNATEASAALNSRNIGLAFKNNYIRVVGSMFTTGLFTFLWSLLLIIPGIYKSYCWRLVPYIIGEDPSIKGSDARALSARMMEGSKWDSFVLDLSFLGWHLLGGLTLGILDLIFTNPYQAATDAELYLTLSGRPTKMKIPAEQKKSAAPDVVFELDQEEIND